MRTIIFMALILLAGHAAAQQDSLHRGVDEFLVRDPALEGGSASHPLPLSEMWVNVPGPLALDDFRGRLVLLYFFSPSVPESVQPALGIWRMRVRYSTELVVIGVQVPRDPYEARAISSRLAVLRESIFFPVLTDSSRAAASMYGVNSLPSFVLISPESRIIRTLTGNEWSAGGDSLVERAIEYFSTRKRLTLKKEEFPRSADSVDSPVLSFPEGIAADERGERLFIADTRHHRILMLDTLGMVMDVIGSGRPGNSDGTFENAELMTPTGMSCSGDLLYFADTQNNAVRVADLDERKIRTLVSPGRMLPDDRDDTAFTLPLSLPHDVLLHDDAIYIAAMGNGAIWRADEDGEELALFAAGQDRPAGLAFSDGALYWVNSGDGSIRSRPVDPSDAEIRTLISPGNTSLRYPLGLSTDGTLLYIADTYGSVIQTCPLNAPVLTVLSGDGVPGNRNGTAVESRFREPAAVAAVGRRLIVADRGNHLVRIVSAGDGSTARFPFLRLQHLSKGMIGTFAGRSLETEPRVVAPGRGVVRFNLRLPEGYELSTYSSSYVDWESRRENVLLFTDFAENEGMSFPYEISYYASPGRTLLVFNAVVYYTRTGSDVCLYDIVRLRVPVDVEDGGRDEIDINLRLDEFLMLEEFGKSEERQ